PCRQRCALHGEPAARRQCPVHDRDGDKDALHRPRLASTLVPTERPLVHARATMSRRAGAARLLRFVLGALMIVSGCTASVGTESRDGADATDRALADLVLVQQGSMPVILTAPHGGRSAIPTVEPRRAQDGTPGPWGGVHTGADASTDVLASGIAAELSKLTG